MFMYVVLKCLSNSVCLKVLFGTVNEQQPAPVDIINTSCRMLFINRIVFTRMNHIHDMFQLKT